MKSVFKDLIAIVLVGAIIWSFRSAAKIIDPECPPQRALRSWRGTLARINTSTTRFRASLKQSTNAC